MANPVISAAYWLERSDLDEIEKAVDLMVGLIAQDKAPTQCSPGPCVRGKKIVAAGTADVVRPRNIKAAYSRASGDITLDPFPKSPDLTAGRGAELASDLMVCRLALRSLLAHEVSHLRQHLTGGLDQDLDAAEQASVQAKKTNSYADYLRYIECPAEMAAHATQLAVEVLDSYGPGLTEAEFEMRCRLVWVFRRALRHDKWLPADEQARLQDFIPVAKTWIDQGYFAYQRLT